MSARGAAGLAVTLALAALACGPLGPIAGGKLDGQLVTEPVSDWSFSDASETVAIETRPDDPYSVNVWAVSSGPSLYVASGSGPGTRWAENLHADPRLRVRIGGRLYERSAVQVSDDAEKQAALALYEKKYDYEPRPEDRGKAVLFRLDPRTD